MGRLRDANKGIFEKHMGRLRDANKGIFEKKPDEALKPANPAPEAAKPPLTSALRPEGQAPPAAQPKAEPKAQPQAPAPKQDSTPKAAAPPKAEALPKAEPVPNASPVAHQNIPPQESTRAYERDHVEKKEFERETHVILSGTVQRIQFGQILTSESVSGTTVKAAEAPGCVDDSHVPGYIWGLGERPKGMAGGLRLVEDDSKKKKEGEPRGDEFIYEQLTTAAKELKRHSLPLEEGPYADKGGLMADYTEKLFKDLDKDAKRLLPNSKDGVKLIMFERVIDSRPFLTPEIERMLPRVFPIFNFVYNEDFMTPDNLPSAGEILGQKRLVTNSVTGASQFYLVHPMEQYLLAISALRRRGFEAYPGHAVVPEMDGSESTRPLIVIMDLSKGPSLTTFDMARDHPSLGAIDILSDVAAMGALHAMRAEARIRHLTVLMAQLSIEGKTVELGTLQNQLERVSRSLFQCAKRWDGCPFIPRTRDYLFQDSVQALLANDPNMAFPDMSAEPIMTAQGLRLPSYAEVTAANYTDFMTGTFARMVAKAKLEKK